MLIEFKPRPLHAITGYAVHHGALSTKHTCAFWPGTLYEMVRADPEPDLLLGSRRVLLDYKGARYVVRVFDDEVEFICPSSSTDW